MLHPADEAVALIREKAADRRSLQHQPRFAAEAGECAYFLLFSSLWITGSVTGPWLRNCCCRMAEKAERISA